MLLNGLHVADFPPIAFVDVDGVLFREGTDEFLPFAADAALLLATTHRIILFTSRTPGPWMERLREEGINVYGYLQKPLGASYCFVDDRLDVSRCGNVLTDAVKDGSPPQSPIWQDVDTCVWEKDRG